MKLLLLNPTEEIGGIIKGCIEVKGDICSAPGERRRVMEVSGLMGKRDL